MGETAPLTLTSGAISVWPQGAPGASDDLTPEGRSGYVNEQVLWLRHRAMADSRCLLRVPEGLGWKGKERIRVEELSPSHHHYQVGQDWRLAENRLLYRDCPISTVSGPSPGRISTTVDVIDPDVVRVEMTVANTSGGPLEEVSAHFCLNHRRAPLLGRSIYAMAEGGWVDFRRYHQYFSVLPEFIRYRFDGGDNPKEVPAITEPMLFSEAVHESGTFVSVIASAAATGIMSNIQWPCTDIDVGFGTIAPGDSVARTAFVGLGLGGRDVVYERISELL